MLARFVLAFPRCAVKVYPDTGSLLAMTLGEAADNLILWRGEKPTSGDAVHRSDRPALVMAAARMTLQFLAQQTASGWFSLKASAAGSSYSMAHLACAAPAWQKTDTDHSSDLIRLDEVGHHTPGFFLLQPALYNGVSLNHAGQQFLASACQSTPCSSISKWLIVTQPYARDWPQVRSEVCMVTLMHFHPPLL